MSAVVICIGAAFFSSAKDVCSKIVSRSITPSLSTFHSFFCSIPFYLLALPFVFIFNLEEVGDSSAFFGILFLRALSDFGAESFKMKSLAEIDLSLAASFLALSPIFLLLLAPIITGDNIGPLGVASVCCVVLATIVLSFRPRSYSNAFSAKGVLFATVSSLFFALNTCFDRLAVQSAGPFQSAFGVTVLACLFSYPVVRHEKTMSYISTLGSSEQGIVSRYLWLRGFLDVVFMLMKLSALLFLAPQYVVALMRSSVLISTVAGFFILGEKDRIRRIIASLIMLVGIVLAVWETV